MAASNTKIKRRIACTSIVIQQDKVGLSFSLRFIFLLWVLLGQRFAS